MYFAAHVALAFSFVIAMTTAMPDGQAIPSMKPAFSEYQRDVDKELQKELNTLKSQVTFFSSTLENTVKENKDLSSELSTLKSSFVDATSQLAKIENAVTEAQNNITQQRASFSELYKQKKELEQLLTKTNNTLTNCTEEISRNVSNVAVAVGHLANQTAYALNQVKDANKVLQSNFIQLSRNQTLLTTQISKRRRDSSDGAAFLVRLSSDRHFSGPGIVIFDKVEFNIDSSYSAASGIFTAPVNGLYTFSATFESTAADITAVIVKNNEQAAYLYGGDNDRHKVLASTSTYLHMNEGDQVWVEWVGNDQTTVKGGIYSQFTGLFVMSD